MKESEINRGRYSSAFFYPIDIYSANLNNVEQLWYLARIFSMRIMGKPGSLPCDKVHKISNPSRRLSGASAKDPGRPYPKTSLRPVPPRTAGFAESYFTQDKPGYVRSASSHISLTRFFPRMRFSLKFASLPVPHDFADCFASS